MIEPLSSYRVLFMRDARYAACHEHLRDNENHVRGGSSVGGDTNHEASSAKPNSILQVPLNLLLGRTPNFVAWPDGNRVMVP